VKIGDIVKHRDRISTDPHPDDVGEYGGWGCVGVVVEVYQPGQTWQIGKPSVWIRYIDSKGDSVLCKKENLEVISESR